MATGKERERDVAVGNGVAFAEAGPRAKFKFYAVDRPGQNSRLHAAEIALEVSIRLARPRATVWPIFSDFNVWQSRFGFVWDRIPAKHEDSFVYLGNKPAANSLSWTDGSRIQYVVRHVVPESLIYFDSLPAPIPDKDGVWTGHNVMSLHDEGGQTSARIFMEHTWYSETMSIEALRAEAKTELDAGMIFWRDYFIPDLISAVESR